MIRSLVVFLAIVMLGACNQEDVASSSAIIGVATPSSVSVVPAN
tara:strand:- start:156 stop:287 length:132 start_codon:yes stop_codon:yes gene_type:complete